MNKILVVDDDESVLEFLQSALETAGYQVSVASTATEAIGKLKSAAEQFPVVLTDIMMPGINGIELLRIIKKEYPETLIIMLTAHMSMESAIKSLNEGAFAYLTKPINVDELKATLKNAYEKYSLVQENRKLLEELRKAKEYSETIVHNLIHAVVATDATGAIKKVNRAMENLLGYKEEELLGSPIQVIFSEEFQQTAWQEMIKEAKVKDFPVSFLTKTGQEIKLLFTGTVMKDTNGQVVGFLGTARSYEDGVHR